MIKYQFNKLINQNISITSKFPTGSGKFKFLNKNKIEVKTIEDPITSKYTIGYDYYFHFLITNYSNKIKELEFLILRKNSKNIINWKASKAPLFYSNDSIKWYLINNIKASKNHKEYSFKIKIKQKTKIFISNNIPIKPNILIQKLKKISNKKPNKISYQEIGLSANKFPIAAIEIDYNKDIKKDRFLIWSGIHPSEPDVFSSLSIIKWIISNDPYAIKARNLFVFDIIPMINPDGFDLGTNGCNKNGVNIYWDFFSKNKTECPESFHLWKYIKSKPPQISLDIHSYIYQTEKQSRPYIFPIKTYPNDFRLPAWSLQKSITKLCNNFALDSKTVQLDSTLGPHLIKRFGTLTLQGYHLHLADGPEEFKNKSINTIKTIINAVLNYQPLHSKKIKYTKVDIAGAFWSIFEKLFDRYPRKFNSYFSKKNKRKSIDSSNSWNEYNKNNKEVKLY